MIVQLSQNLWNVSGCKSCECKPQRKLTKLQKQVFIRDHKISIYNKQSTDETDQYALHCLMGIYMHFTKLYCWFSHAPFWRYQANVNGYFVFFFIISISPLVGPSQKGGIIFKASLILMLGCAKILAALVIVVRLWLVWDFQIWPTKTV